MRWSPLLVIALALTVAACGGRSSTIPPSGSLQQTESSSFDRAALHAEKSLLNFTVPTSASLPLAIAHGPDGNMWFVEQEAGKVGRVSPFGAITEFSIGSSTRPTHIIAGPDGNLWITLRGTGEIAKCSRNGVITRYPTGTRPFISTPNRLVVGPDSNIWFTDTGNNAVVDMTIAGRVVSTYYIAGTATTSSEPFDITVGPDNNIWVTEFLQRKVTRIEANGSVIEFDTGPDLNGQSSNPAGIRTADTTSLIISRPYLV